jgi:putative membrane protein
MKIVASILGLSLSAFGGVATVHAAAGTIDDAQIAKIVLTINKGEIEAGKLAMKEGKSKEVKDFAKAMVKEHEKNTKETTALAKKADLSPADSPESEALEKEAKESNADLKKAKADLDKTYVSQQVMMHEKALNKLDKDLIPGATNAALKAHLEKTRAAVAEHLEHAKSLQAKM